MSFRTLIPLALVALVGCGIPKEQFEEAVKRADTLSQSTAELAKRLEEEKTKGLEAAKTSEAAIGAWKQVAELGAANTAHLLAVRKAVKDNEADCGKLLESLTNHPAKSFPTERAAATTAIETAIGKEAFAAIDAKFAPNVATISAELDAAVAGLKTKKGCADKHEAITTAVKNLVAGEAKPAELAIDAPAAPAAAPAAAAPAAAAPAAAPAPTAATGQ